jgi:acyl-homoserine lactone acylase PvdQ
VHNRLAVLGLGAVTALFAATPASAAKTDFAGTALNIIPSGQPGAYPPPPDADRQAKLYDGLTPLFGSVHKSDLGKYFKSERLGTKGQGPTTAESVPRAGLKIVRDGFHVPHITGKTHDAVTFGAGWVIAEDRGLLLEQARYNARVAAVDAPGLSALGLISSLQTFTPSQQTENEVAKQTQQLQRAGKKGRAILHDIDVYIEGINAFYKKTGNTAAPWTRNDVYALNALKGQFVGQGGGDEVRRSEFLQGLQARLGPARGFSVFNDLRERNDPERITSIPGSFPYGQVPKSRAGNAIVDDGSLNTSALRAIKANAAARTHASNVLMIGPKASTNGHPLMVGGPQIGYFYPGLTLEMELKGPGYDVRGATSAPFPGYILIGRGENFAWTLTSAGSDIIDQYVETLCGGSDTKYMYKGQCVDMGFFDAGSLNGTPDKEVTFHTTVHGPVLGYATVNGTRVAISQKRSSYGKDVLDLLFYHDISVGKVHSAKAFIRAASQTPQTFNSFYLDDRQIAEFTSGLLPKRPKNVDPGLPTMGTGQFEWRGFEPAKTHMQAILGGKSKIVNWNNVTARNFQAADDEWAYGAEQRVQLLNNGLLQHAKRGGKQDLASVTSAMNQAATQDVRAAVTLPVLAAVLKGGPAPNARDQQMLTLLEAWRRNGSSRLDRNLDGLIDDPGAAIMDRAWPKIANAALSPVIGPQEDELASLYSRFDLPPGGQYSGWHTYIDKDLRTLLGKKVKGKFANRYCGGGDLTSCRNSLWAAMDVAGNELQAEQGSDPSAWHSDAVRERIKFVPAGLLPLTMRYTNRPTGIQQVITFTGHPK